MFRSKQLPTKKETVHERAADGKNISPTPPPTANTAKPQRRITAIAAGSTRIAAVDENNRKKRKAGEDSGSSDFSSSTMPQSSNSVGYIRPIKRARIPERPSKVITKLYRQAAIRQQYFKSTMQLNLPNPRTLVQKEGASVPGTTKNKSR